MVSTGKRPLEEGLVLDLRMSEGAGSIAHDVSGQRNHGVLGAGAAAPTWAVVDGISVLDFDGIDDTVTTTNNIPMSGSRTMMTWITPDFDYDDGLLHSYVDWRHATSRKIFLAKHTDNKTRFLHDSFDDGGVYLSNAIAIIFSAGERHHVAGVFDIDTKTVNLYWDGISVSSVTNEGAVSLTNTSPVRIGHGTWGFHKGIIEGVLIYNRVLSAEEIALYYTQRRRM